MKKNQVDYTIIAPCYNEEGGLEKFILRIIPLMESLNKEFEILLINDGSSDDTLNIAKQLAQNFICSSISFISKVLFLLKKA